MKIRATMAAETVRIALASVVAHKLRTILTLLGIIIGVASVMVVAAGLEGAESYVIESVSKALGSNSFILNKFVRFGSVSDDEWQEMLRRNQDLKLDDVFFLREFCYDCQEIAGELGSTQTTYSGSQEMLGTTIRGVTPNYVFLGNFQVEEGRFFSEREGRTSAAVCVIGWDLKEKFFPTVDAVVGTIKVRGRPLRVVGIQERLGSNFGRSQDNVLYLPISTFQKIFGSRGSITIRGKAFRPEDFDSVLDQVRMGMRIRHKLRPDEKDDFGLISTQEINSSVDQFSATVATVVLPITFISLLVGGIVIMNIMLVSVTERTFEIGIRKAVGGRKRDILYQFLVESFLLAALGGAIGLLLASLVGSVVEMIFEFPMVFRWSYTILALGFSGSIGIISGIYPAYKASKLDPIIAMTERH